MNAGFLTCRNISFKWGDRRVLDDISFNLEKGKRLVIAGETGSGKSSLFKIIAGLLQPCSGSVELGDHRIPGPEEKLVPGNPAIAYLSQHFELPRFLRVEQVLLYANTLTVESAGNLYRLCQVDHLLQRKTDELSGGEKQRIALARLLTTSPSLLLLDEPFSHLDMDHKKTLKQVVDDVSYALDMTCMMISHNPEDTLPWADEIIVLKHGTIIQTGSPSEVYFDPLNEYVAGLFGHYTVVNSGDETMLLRPEQVTIKKREGSTTEGVVRKVMFFGIYSLATIESDEGRIVIAVVPPGTTIRVSQRVYVSWQAGSSQQERRIPEA